MDGAELVGWADVVPLEGTETAHRGTLGMGLLPDHRGAGIGGRLLAVCLQHAPRSKISKVELTVFTDNAPAIALYRKFGFTEIGVTRDFLRRTARVLTRC